MPPDSSKNFTGLFFDGTLFFILSLASSTTARDTPESGARIAVQSLRGFMVVFCTLRSRRPSRLSSATWRFVTVRRLYQETLSVALVGI